MVRPKIFIVILFSHFFVYSGYDDIPYIKMLAHAWHYCMGIESSAAGIFGVYSSKILSLIQEEEHKEAIQKSWYPLHYACTHGLNPVINFFISKKVLYNEWDDIGCPDELLVLPRREFYFSLVHCQCIPLHRACIAGNVPVVVLLLQEGGARQCAIKNSYGFTALHFAVHWNHTGIVDVLLQYGADSNSQDERGRTPLMHASFCGHESLVTLLLTKRVKCDVLDAYGDSALSCALYNQRYGCVKKLLLYGCSSNTFSFSQESPLCIACKNNDLACVRLVYAYGGGSRCFQEYTLEDLYKKLLQNYRVYICTMHNFDITVTAYEIIMRALCLLEEDVLMNDDFFWKIFRHNSHAKKSKLWAHAWNKERYRVASHILLRYPFISLYSDYSIKNVPSYKRESAQKNLCKASYLCEQLYLCKKFYDCSVITTC